MTIRFVRARLSRWGWIGIISAALFLGACSLRTGVGPTGATRPIAGDLEIEDVSRIPQRFEELPAAGDLLPIAGACRDQLLADFRSRFFAPWSAAGPALDSAETKDFMGKVGRGKWYGVNKRKVPPQRMQELIENCALDSFPSRNETAISVAPGHLRGLPTNLPLFETANGYPFDMLSYPQVKLNEPLRVLHTSRDGIWLFVETGYSNGWLEARDVALVDRRFIEAWMQEPHLVVVQDLAPVPDGRGTGLFRSKVGTILPLLRADEVGWEVAVASAGEGGTVQSRPVRLPRDTGAPFPLEFSRDNTALVGDQLLGEPYGWGEMYDLRDCSATLRDFFLPFGIWLPRTSVDQIASARRVELEQLTPPEKEDLIKRKGLPFLTLLYKPGHIMLYVGVDREGRPLVFHNAWSIRFRGEGGDKTRILGTSVITTLEPGKELGLVPGGSLLERATELSTLTDRCLKSP
jgi:hypothetical protein